MHLMHMRVLNRCVPSENSYAVISRILLYRRSLISNQALILGIPSVQMSLSGEAK